MPLVFFCFCAFLLAPTILYKHYYLPSCALPSLLYCCASQWHTLYTAVLLYFSLWRACWLLFLLHLLGYNHTCHYLLSSSPFYFNIQTLLLVVSYSSTSKASYFFLLFFLLSSGCYLLHSALYHPAHVTETQLHISLTWNKMYSVANQWVTIINYKYYILKKKSRRFLKLLLDHSFGLISQQLNNTLNLFWEVITPFFFFFSLFLQFQTRYLNFLQHLYSFPLLSSNSSLSLARECFCLSRLLIRELYCYRDIELHLYNSTELMGF